MTDFRYARWVQYLPLVLIETYLLFSLALLVWGPIDWHLHNPSKFWSLIALYHLTFIVGFALVQRKVSDQIDRSSASNTLQSLEKGFWVLLTLALIATLIGHRNLVHTPSYIPYGFFSDFYQGLINPLDRYIYKLSPEAAQNFAGNVYVTAFYALTICTKFILITFMVAEWPKLSVPKRCVGVVVALIPFFSGISVGTNKPLFDLLFLFAAALMIEFLVNAEGRRWSFFMSRKSLVLLVIFLLIACPMYFKHTMSQRMSSSDYVESTASAGEIRLKAPAVTCSTDGCPQEGRLQWLSVVATTYLVQGYYGMSLALDEPFDSTLGVGNSHFMLDVLNKYLGVDLSQRTFQHKISNQWNERAQWHSFYSQFANDVGFWGVGLVMLVLGAVSSAVWTSAVRHDNFLARSLLPLFAILFLYLPANNQIFNILETLSSFMVLMAAWLLTLIWGPSRSTGASVRVPDATRG